MREKLLRGLCATTGPIPWTLLGTGTLFCLVAFWIPVFWVGQVLLSVGTGLLVGSGCWSMGWRRGLGHARHQHHLAHLQIEAETLPDMIARVPEYVPREVVVAMQRRLREVKEELADG